MASQRSNHSQASNAQSHSVGQSQQLSIRATYFLRYNYHTIHLASKPNNHAIVLKPKGYPPESKEQISILENHYLTPTLAKIREDVLDSYLSQFWLSASLKKVNNCGLCITRYATHQSVPDLILMNIHKTKLRVALGIPSKKDLNLEKYSDEPTDDELCRFAEFIGYNEPLVKRTDSRSGRLPPLSNTIFSILN